MNVVIAAVLMMTSIVISDKIVHKEMMNLNVAARMYQANAAILKRYQAMVETTLELLK